MITERIVEIIAQNAALILASVVGAVCHVVLAPPRSFWRGLAVIFVGVAFAVFLAPGTVSFLPWMDADDAEIVSAFALLYGITGILLAELLLGTVKKVRDEDQSFSDAIKKSLIDLLSRSKKSEPEQ